MNTEVRSNTGEQASKATPTGATAKFVASGKVQAKKKLGLMQTQHKNVYIAYVPMGANPAATVKAFNAAENYNGPVQTGAAAIPPPLLSSPSHGSLKRSNLLL